MRNEVLAKLLARNIRTKREELGRTQEEITELAGLSRTSLVNIESGLQGVTLSNLYALAEALGIDPRELLPNPDELEKARVLRVNGYNLVLTDDEIAELRAQLEAQS